MKPASILRMRAATAPAPVPWEPMDDAVQPQHWFDLQDASTLFTDTAGTTPVTTDGQAIARINDKGAQGANATQGTPANCPIYVAASNVSGLPAARINGANGKRMTFVSSLGALVEFLFNSTLTNVDCKLDTTDHFSGAVFTDLGNASILGATWLAGSGTGSVTFWQNGSAVVTLNSLTISASGGIFIVQDAASTGGSGFGRWINTNTLFNRSFDTARAADADVAEMLTYTATGDWDKVNGFLAHKWALEAKLDAGHPYKSAAP